MILIHVYYIRELNSFLVQSIYIWLRKKDLILESKVHFFSSSSSPFPFLLLSPPFQLIIFHFIFQLIHFII